MRDNPEVGGQKEDLQKCAQSTGQMLLLINMESHQGTVALRRK